MKARTCSSCGNLAGCPLIRNNIGEFNFDLLVTKDTKTPCATWSPATKAQEEVRSFLFGLQGLGFLRIINAMPPGKDFNEEITMPDIPDFVGMITPDMDSKARKEQLLYDYDSLNEDGLPHVRPCFQLKKYACDPDGPIRLDHSVGMFWTTTQIVDFIIKTELEQGLLSNSKKKGNSKMAESKRVVLRKGTPSKAGTGKVGRPPKKTGASAVKLVKPEEGETKAEVKASAPTADNSKELQDLKAQLETLNTEFKSVMEMVEKNINDHTTSVVTMLHDLLAQTNGTMAYQQEDDEGNPVFDEDGDPVMVALEEKFAEKNKIMSYIEGK